MYKDKRILAVVPARGGSKGVKLKNIHLLLGIPLIGWTAKLLKEVVLVDRAVVSTDSEVIAEVARQYGLDAPFLRPPHLSGDFVGDWDVLVHALEEVEKLDRTQYGVVIMLQPTSPLRKVEHVEESVRKLVDEKWDSVWTVSPVDLKFHPLKQLRVSKEGKLDYYDSRGSAIIARQQLEQLYYRNGASYAISRECLLGQKKLLGDNSGALIIDEPLISIDTIQDFNKVERILNRTQEQ